MFGKFRSIESFLASYVKSVGAERMEAMASMSLKKQAVYLQAIAFKDIVEINATILKKLPDDLKAPKHYQLTITLDKILNSPVPVKKDIQECLSKKLPVFVAIRYGDRDGLAEPIVKGMEAGNRLHLKGQWITRQKAYAHGGEKTSVLHFTHHPAGFTCTVEKCYS